MKSLLTILLCCMAFFMPFCSEDSKAPKLPGLGSQAPGFSCRDLEGRTWTLDQTKGQVVMVRFWADWCPYCRFEMPVIEKYYRLLKDKGFQVLAVNVKQSAQVAEAFIAQMDVTFPVLLDTDGRIAESYGVYAIPTNFLVDKEGKIREVLVGEVFREEKVLKQVLKPYFAGLDF